MAIRPRAVAIMLRLKTDFQATRAAHTAMAEPSVTLRRYCLSMCRVALRVVLMTITAVAVGVAAFLIASVVLEWL
jgi:hypothetical protein